MDELTVQFEDSTVGRQRSIIAVREMLVNMIEHYACRIGEDGGLQPLKGSNLLDGRERLLDSGQP